MSASHPFKAHPLPEETLGAFSRRHGVPVEVVLQLNPELERLHVTDATAIPPPSEEMSLAKRVIVLPSRLLQQRHRGYGQPFIVKDYMAAVMGMVPMALVEELTEQEPLEAEAAVDAKNKKGKGKAKVTKGKGKSKTKTAEAVVSPPTSAAASSVKPSFRLLPSLALPPETDEEEAVETEPTTMNWARTGSTSAALAEPLVPHQRAFTTQARRLHEVVSAEAQRAVEGEESSDTNGITFDTTSMDAFYQSQQEELDKSPLESVRSRAPFDGVERKGLGRRKGGYHITPGPVDMVERANRAPPKFIGDSIAEGSDATATTSGDVMDPADRLLQADQLMSSQVLMELEADGRAAQGPSTCKTGVEAKVNSLEVASVTPPTSDLNPGFTDFFVLEVAVIDVGSSHSVKEVWEFLPSQPLTMLGDVLSCRNGLLPYPYTRNNFYYIGGAFFVDDRHDGWEDLSAAVREWDPFGNGEPIYSCSPAQSEDGAQLPAPLHSASKTTFGDLRIWLGEHCCYRHLATCDHRFYFRTVRRESAPISHSTPFEKLSPEVQAALEDPTTGVGECLSAQRKAELRQMSCKRYPYLREGYSDRPLLCAVCETLPSTIASYNDPIAPTNPTVFCRACYDLLHQQQSDSKGRDPHKDGKKAAVSPGEGTATAAEQQQGGEDSSTLMDDGSVMYQLPPRCYFTH